MACSADWYLSKLDRGIGYRPHTAFQVFNTITNDGERQQRWWTLYTIAVKVFALERKSFQLRADLRNMKIGEVPDLVQPIKSRESRPLRPPTYDALIGVLLPEMQPLLEKLELVGVTNSVRPQSPLLENMLPEGKASLLPSTLYEDLTQFLAIPLHATLTIMSGKSASNPPAIRSATTNVGWFTRQLDLADVGPIDLSPGGQLVLPNLEFSPPCLDLGHVVGLHESLILFSAHAALSVFWHHLCTRICGTETIPINTYLGAK